MLDLCDILGISVNEFLNGEKIEMKDYGKNTEALLVELTIQEEIKNKKLLTNMYVLIIVTSLFYVSFVLLASFTLKEGLGMIAFVATAMTVIVAFYVFKLEVDAGYYGCRNCHHRYIQKSYLAAMLAPHINTTRYLKCPKCNKRSWSKKVMTKD